MKNKKMFLEYYGIFRMIIGIAQLAGILAGYFLLEFVLRYPKGAVVNLFDRDILVLTYLAIFLRGIFHTITGIGIARVKLWGRGWLIFGWPIVMIITFGLVYTTVQEWITAGLITGFLEGLAWVQLLIYLAFISFDYFYVNKGLLQINQGEMEPEIADSGVEVKHVTALFIVAVLFFSTLIFLGKPMSQGYHKGFYKSGKQKTTTKRQVPLTTKAVKADTQKTIDTTIQKGLKPQRPVLTKPKIVSLSVEEEQSVDLKEKTTSGKIKRTQPKKTFPYRKMIGFVGGFFIIAGFIFQLLEINTGKATSASSFILLAIGFFLWIVFGTSSKIMAVTLTSFISLLLLICIIIMAIKKEYQE